MLSKGSFIRVKTKTKDDVFGEVVYEIVETGLPCRFCHGNDGMKCVMLGGTGPAARPDYFVRDCEKTINMNIKSGQTKIITQEQAKLFIGNMQKKQNGTGCLDI